MPLHTRCIFYKSTINIIVLFPNVKCTANNRMSLEKLPWQLKIDEEFFFPFILIYKIFFSYVTIERIQSVNLEMRVQTPGKLGSAQPMPQLMMPPRNHRPSLPLTTRGPPESPWNKYENKNIFEKEFFFCKNTKKKNPTVLPDKNLYPHDHILHT